MELTSIFSDDQLAIVGCFLALAGCGLVAAVSFHFGPAGRQTKNVGQPVESAKTAVQRTPERRDERKAA